MELKFNIGAGNCPIEGYESVDLGQDVYLDEKLNGLVSTIYTSHFLEYFDKVEVMALLMAWRDRLQDGGELFISVPNFAKIVDIYQKEGIIMDGALYGKMHNPPIYHKSTFDRKTLREALLLAGFRNVTNFYPSQNDCSKDPISLNLKCRK